MSSSVPDLVCAACEDSTPFLSTLVADGCVHNYCKDCVTEMVSLAMTDRTSYPPSCCDRAFQHSKVMSLLPTDLATEYSAKLEELDDRRPVYCAQPGCARYISEDSRTTNLGMCSSCSNDTCLVCKKLAHADACKPDAAEQELRELATQEGWRSCIACAVYVEKSHGCNHMTCVCGAQFCYVCGKKWKTCACEQFDEQDEDEEADFQENLRRVQALPEFREWRIRELMLGEAEVLEIMQDTLREEASIATAQIHELEDLGLPDSDRSRALRERVQQEEARLRGVLTGAQEVRGGGTGSQILEEWQTFLEGPVDLRPRMPELIVTMRQSLRSLELLRWPYLQELINLTRAFSPEHNDVLLRYGAERERIAHTLTTARTVLDEIRRELAELRAALEEDEDVDTDGEDGDEEMAIDDAEAEGAVVVDHEMEDVE